MPKKGKKKRAIARAKWRNRGFIPQFEVGDIQLQRVEARHALQHKTLCDTSSESIGSYLGWAENVSKWRIKDHIGWLTVFNRIPEPFNSYGAFYKDRLVGFFSYGAAVDHLGVQICYYVSDYCAGRGIASAVTDTLVQKAFVMGKHIDIENIPSQMVARKVGFEQVHDYKCAKSGNKGSGQMQVWVKINPNTKYGVTLEDFREGKFEYLTPAYQDLNSAYRAAALMAEIADGINKVQLALAGKIPISELESLANKNSEADL